MSEEDVNPKQIDEVEILNPEDRIFKAWGSVEVRDRENDLLPMDEFKKIMPVIMDRGGILMDQHSNRQVGKLLNYNFKMKQTSEGPKLGVYLTGKIFKNYEHDDMVWQGIKAGIYKGLSFGGRNKIKDVVFDKNGLTNVLTKLEGFEFSLVPGMGNQEATMEEINYLAKSEIQKPFAGFKDFDDCVSKQKADGKSEESAKNICGRIKSDVEKIEKEYAFIKNMEKALTENDLSLSTVSKNSEKYLKENALNKSMEDSEIQKINESVEKNSNSIEEINKKLDLLLKQKEEEDEEDKEKKKAEHLEDEDEDDQEKKKQDPEDKDKKPEEELEKEGGSEGERKVKLPKVPSEETGGGEPAQGGEGEDVKFIEKDEVNDLVAEEIKKQLLSMVNKNAVTPTPAVNKLEVTEKPKDLRDIAKMIRNRSEQ